MENLDYTSVLQFLLESLEKLLDLLCDTWEIQEHPWSRETALKSVSLTVDPFVSLTMLLVNETNGQFILM